MPTRELDISEFGEERKCLLAEGRFLGDLIPLMRSPVLVGESQPEIPVLALGENVIGGI